MICLDLVIYFDKYENQDEKNNFTNKKTYEKTHFEKNAKY